MTGTGQAQTHAGKASDPAKLCDQWKDPPPDLTLVVDRVDLDGAHVRADWTCTSPVFPSPMRSCDLFTLDAAGKIKRLEIIVTESPPIGH